jgi:protein-L-isoaspartate(D-aspartate) O-methyltransferase
MRMGDDPFETPRRQMMAEIVTEAVLTADQTGRAAFGARVLAAVEAVPRHEFVPIELQSHAYLNRPLPIGFDKTVSQPYIVALMTDLLDLERSDVVLEVGTGAGYQAAVLARLARRVYSVELIEELAAAADRRLKRLGCANVETRVANGYYGWPEHAPYDKIMVTAAADLIPPPLLAQLKPGGRMVVPTGIPDKQALVLVEKSAAGSLSTREILPVRFSELEDPGTTAGAA